ncbi:MAG TPA: glycoside hydrolase family 3 N-terminal domain-containing protein [Streptosporangiaceae bacterium]|nr:glycoside hydrolase family 3 N-terminal domain-containing protein [Streptosporangiaceae bacterium]
MVRRQVAAWVLSLVLACSGCGLTSGGHPAAGPPGTSASIGSMHPAPSQAAPSPRAAEPLSCPALVFSQMTVAQRVGQLFLVGIADDPRSEVARAVAAYHFGSLLFGTTSTASLAEVRQVTAADQSLASSAATARVRFLVAADQEGGEVQRLRGPGFSAIPSAVAQGELASGALRREAAGWGRELKLAGINLDLAPVMDVVPSGTASRNQPIGALMREYGSAPATVASHGVAFIRGMRQDGVATTAKHFPGLGRVTGNTDLTAGVTDPVTAPGDPYLGSFQAAIDAGVPFVMVALARYPRIDPRHLAVFSSRTMRGLLRQQMHFGGVIVSDDMGAAAAVAGISPAVRAIGFLAAGGDMITTVSLAAAAAMYTAVLSRVKHDPVFRSEADSAVRHILTAKHAYGLLPCAAG